MSAFETLSLMFLVAGVAAILRFVWLDSQRFPERDAEVPETAFVSSRTVERLVRQADAARVMAEADTLPKAA